MNETTLRTLALDTLFGNRIGPPGSCFVVNEAGIELAGKDVDALTVIEHVIVTVIRPKLDDSIGSSSRSRFIGLNYLIGAYLVIGVRFNENRVFDFLREQPRIIQIEAARCCSIFFRNMGQEYNFGVAPNKSLLQFLANIAKSANQLAQLAIEVHDELVQALQSPP